MAHCSLSRYFLVEKAGGKILRVAGGPPRLTVALACSHCYVEFHQWGIHFSYQGKIHRED